MHALKNIFLIQTVKARPPTTRQTIKWAANNRMMERAVGRSGVGQLLVTLRCLSWKGDSRFSGIFQVLNERSSLSLWDWQKLRSKYGSRWDLIDKWRRKWHWTFVIHELRTDDTKQSESRSSNTKLHSLPLQSESFQFKSLCAMMEVIAEWWTHQELLLVIHQTLLTRLCLTSWIWQIFIDSR